MIVLFIYLNTFIFVALSALHFYWAFGGKWALAGSIPTSNTGKPIFNPGRMGTLVVALGLLAFALVSYMHQDEFFPFLVPYLNKVTLAISLIFLLRAIGDFKYIGLFKRIKGTTFAVNDNKTYIPLCFYLAMSCLLIVIL